MSLIAQSAPGNCSLVSTSIGQNIESLKKQNHLPFLRQKIPRLVTLHLRRKQERQWLLRSASSRIDILCRSIPQGPPSFPIVIGSVHYLAKQAPPFGDCAFNISIPQ